MKNRTHYVVIPVVNCWEHTKKCIESLQCKEKMKIILVDNGSNDATIDEARKIDDLIYISNSENRGVSHAWNQGIAAAKEDKNCGYIYIVNNDNVFRKDSIDNLITYADQVDLGHSNYVLISSMTFVGDPAEFNGVPVTFTEAEGGCYSAFMIAPKTTDKVGWFDEGFYPAYFEDNDYDRRIKALGFLSTKTTSSLFIAGRSKTIAENPFVAAQVSQGHAQRYYRQKWGGFPGKETFEYPFNKASNELNCTDQGDPLCKKDTK